MSTTKLTHQAVYRIITTTRRIWKMVISVKERQRTVLTLSPNNK